MDLVVLLLCFILFKISMSAITILIAIPNTIHTNVIQIYHKCLSSKFMRVLPINSSMIPVNLIQHRGRVGMFNNYSFASSTFNYSYFSKKCYNYDTFRLTIVMIFLTFWHYISVLSNWKFVSRGNSYLDFFQTLLVFATFQERSFI